MDTFKDHAGMATRRIALSTAIGALAAIVMAGMPVSAAAAAPKTIEPGKLTVGFNGDMPMTSWKDGKLIGTDGALLAHIAEDLGLEIKPQQMEWSALIQATKQGKVDIMLGSMGWTKERTKIMLLTDPIYYFGTFLLQKKDTNYSTFADISGHKIGTVTGFTLVPELKSIPNVGEVKLYDTSDGVMRDLIAGRLDMAVLDPGLVEYALLQHPEWGLHQVALVPEADKYPIMSTKYYSIMGIWPEEKELYDAINKEITKAWADCSNVKTMSAYGLGNPSWFDPPPKDYRIGVDRPDGWQAPKAPASCFAK
ncbi:MAG: amino acid ABC transporter substrate-binding protein [Methylobacteriaceae bacterium]|nr:amino acid ABC transporter substrate-binding protein [Methylobacteriaceae bacterium]